MILTLETIQNAIVVGIAFGFGALLPLFLIGGGFFWWLLAATKEKPSEPEDWNPFAPPYKKEPAEYDSGHYADLGQYPKEVQEAEEVPEPPAEAAEWRYDPEKKEVVRVDPKSGKVERPQDRLGSYLPSTRPSNAGAETGMEKGILDD